jgi:hypothetical protein
VIVALVRFENHPYPLKLSVNSFNSFGLDCFRLASSIDMSYPCGLNIWIEFNPTNELWPLFERILKTMLKIWLFFLLILINFWPVSLWLFIWEWYEALRLTEDWTSLLFYDLYSGSLDVFMASFWF